MPLVKFMPAPRLVITLLSAGFGAAFILWAGGCSATPSPVTKTGEKQASGTVEVPKAPALSAASEAREAEAEPRERQVQRRAWSYAGFDGEAIFTENYEIYTTARREDFVDQLPVFFEAALDHYTSFFGELPRPNQPLETYLFQDRRQWQVKTQEVLPNQANIFNTLGRGGFATRGVAVLYYIDHPRSRSSRDTYAIAAHEGWHQYTQSTFRQSLPIWLEEGIATYMEGFRLRPDGSVQFRPWANNERRMALYEAVRTDRLIPLAELLHRSPQDFLERGKNRLLIYYAQVWALSRFMMEYGEGRYQEPLREVLQDAAHGRLGQRLRNSTVISGGNRRGAATLMRSGPWVLLEYFNRDLEAFEDAYFSYIRTITSRGRR